MGVQWGLFVKLRVGDRDKQQVFGIICLRQKCAPNSPWRNRSFFAICDEACGNGKMIRDADQRRQELGGPAKGSPSGTGQSAKVAQLLGRHDFSTRGVYPRSTACAE